MAEPTRPSAALTALDAALAPSPFSLASGSPYAKVARPSDHTHADSTHADDARAEPPARDTHPLAPHGACRPYARADYYARLATYTAAEWFAPHDALAPPACARHGWSLSAPRTLHCATCGSSLKVPDAAPADEALALELAPQLSAAHLPLCPWLNNPSPSSFGSLLLASRFGAAPCLVEGTAAAAEALRRRYAALCRLPSLPRLGGEMGTRLDEAARHMGRASGEALVDDAVALCQGGDAADARALLRRRTAATLALLGWDTVEQQRAAGADAAALLTCVEDARVVALWLYEALEPLDAASAAAAPTTDNNGSTSEQLLASFRSATGGGAKLSGSQPVHLAKIRFDPLGEHRAWSPWLAVASGDSLAAWARVAWWVLGDKSAAGGGDSMSAGVARGAHGGSEGASACATRSASCALALLREL